MTHMATVRTESSYLSTLPVSLTAESLNSRNGVPICTTGEFPRS